MGGTSVDVPKQTAGERKLQKMQAKMLKQQSNIIKSSYRQAKNLLPFFAEQMGLDVEYNKRGRIKGFSLDEEAQALKDQGSEIQKLLNEKTLAGLKGELPVDPVLERELAKQEETLRQRLSSQFGAGYETSSPAIETMDEFFRSAEGLRYSARRGEITLAEQLGLARSDSTNAGNTTLANIMRSGAVGDPLSFASATGSNAGGYGNAQIPYIQNRQMQLNADIFNAQQQASMLGGIGQLAGSLFGAVFPMSDERLKEDLEQIGFIYPGLPVYVYRYIGGVTKRLGVLAQDVLKARPSAVGWIGDYMWVRYKELHNG
jgi:hypothetical protein